MIWSAALLMRKHGVEGTSFSEVIERSRAPRGSIYHHFPGGKAQLVEEATRYAGDVVAALFTQAIEKGDPLEGLDAIGDFWRGVLHDSDFAAGCPVLAATLDSNASPGARAAAGEA